MTLRSRVGSLGELVPVSLVEPDGLIVTTDGRYVRVIECDRVPNTITADPAQLARVEAAFAQLCQTIGDRQSLMILAQTDPVPIADALASDREATRVAAAQDHAAGQPDLARARRRLLAATEQTVIAAADAEQPAVAARWWVVVPYRPVIDDPRRQLQALAAGAKHRVLWATHRDAAVESLRYCAQVDGALRRAGIDTWPLDGTQTLALLWERLHPAAETTPDFERLARRLPGRRRHRPRRWPPGSATSCWRRCARTRPRGWTSPSIRRGSATPTGAWRRPSISPPRRWRPTRRGWRTCSPARCPPPWRCTSRSGCAPGSGRVSGAAGSGCAPPCATRTATTGWSAQTRRTRLRRPRPSTRSWPGSSAPPSTRSGSTARCATPPGDPESFERTVKQTCADFHTLTNARVVRGRHLALHGFTSTLPLGHRRRCGRGDATRSATSPTASR